MKTHIASPFKNTKFQDDPTVKRILLIDEIEKNGTVLTHSQKLHVLLYGKVKSIEELEEEKEKKARIDKFIAYGVLPAAVLAFAAVLITLL